MSDPAVRPDREVARFAWFWTLHSFLRQLVLIYPVYAIFMTERGITANQLSWLFALWSLSVVVLEVPSGTLGDRYSRRAVVSIGTAIKGLGFVAWYLVPNFWGFLVGFWIWGLGSALRSGTAESLLFDTLRHHGQEVHFERLLGRGRAASMLGAGLSFLVGGWMAESGFELPLLLSAMGPWIAAAISALFFVEPPRGATDEQTPELGYFGLLRDGLTEVRRNPGLGRLLLLLSTGVVAVGVMDEFIGTVLRDDGLSLTLIGFGWALIMVATTIASLRAHRLRGSLLAAAALLLATALALVGVAPSRGWASVTLLAAAFACSEAVSVVLEGQVQRAIEGPARATITSVAGLGQEATSVALMVSCGLVATGFGWQALPPFLGSVAVLGAGLAVASHWAARKSVLEREVVQ